MVAQSDKHEDARMEVHLSGKPKIEVLVQSIDDIIINSQIISVSSNLHQLKHHRSESRNDSPPYSRASRAFRS